VVDTLAERVQLPDSRGTSTVSKPGPSVPDSSPLIAFAFDDGATGRAVVVVTLEDPLTADHVVFVVLAVTITGVVGAVTFVEVVEVVEVVVVETCVGVRAVTGDVEEGGRDEAAGACGGDDALRVKTSTSKSSGLYHIRRWALFSEKGERGMVFEG
jgi:hypothetical protein